jgi:hypothetical protein
VYARANAMSDDARALGIRSGEIAADVRAHDLAASAT